MIVTTQSEGIFAVALAIAAVLLVGALLAAAWRVWRGPTLADRVVALDMVSVVMIVFLVLFRMVSGVEAYIYVAIAMALISFLGTVAFAAYIERSGGRSDG
jgi:multicomponent Na+:H+ antiporter subunit F